MRQLKEFILKYLLKFGVVGILNTLIQNGIYFVFILLKVQFLVSQTLSFLIAFLCSYVLNSKFTYRVPLSLKQLVTFFLANVPAYLIQLFVLVIVVEGFAVPKSIALFCTLFITIPLSFILVSVSMVKSKSSSALE